ncbi:hypothetical protein FRB96_005420 [Tulasnella sp. 330]|nr:hypothetical protein FRB96_005420 [Tulasnella sp. 330]KAG8871520.1 hypothetical protein FRB97_008608 [Tulasnella sp. 331]KAG8875403.1 hypothetical protein FRB98_007815 [Tulasnella sp. 332]
MSPNVSKNLFTPLRVGDIQLLHRIVMAPLTRLRATKENVPSEIAREYYSQRASPGGLIISEGTMISEAAGGYPHAPGIWTDAQIAAWKLIAEDVHAKGGLIFMQIAAMGRSANADILKASGHYVVSPGDIPINEGDPAPERLSREGMYQYLEDFTQAAKNAVIKAGFDGVELHAANGYFLDQVISANANNRTDEFGGSIENRSWFILKLISSVADAIGQGKTAIRFSPFSTSQNVLMSDELLEAQFTHLVTAIRDEFPHLAYLHVIEPRIEIEGDESVPNEAGNNKSLDFLREAWGRDRESSPIFSAGGHTLDTAQQTVAEHGGAVVFGRAFISNPDLPLRLKRNLELTRPDRSTFYSMGPQATKGYIDYPFSSELPN